MVERCLLCWRESALGLAQAVRDDASDRTVLIDPGLSEKNAVYATRSTLWGLCQDRAFAPEDEIRESRRISCDDTSDSRIVERLVSYRASAGHPNVVGARRYAEAILAALKALR